MTAAFEPDVARALDLMRAANTPSFETLTIAEARRRYRAGRDTVQLEPVEMAEVETLTVAGRPARRYRPHDASPAGTILFFHGGGYVIGDLDTHDSICRRLARAAGSDLIALDYRLAPENRFPAAFDDCDAAYAELADRGRAVALAGDSAGGSLALGVAIAARDAGRSLPCALALFYPVGDLAAEAPSYAEVSGVPISAATMRWFWRRYLPDAAAALDWRASPLRADLSGMPPSFVTTSGHDPLRDEGRALVVALRAAGARVDHRDLPGQVHGYLTIGRLVGEATRSIEAAGAFLAGRLTEVDRPPE